MKHESKQVAIPPPATATTHLEFQDPRLFRDLLGQHDQHVKILQNTLQVRIRIRGAALEIDGDLLQVELAS